MGANLYKIYEIKHSQYNFERCVIVKTSTIKKKQKMGKNNICSIYLNKEKTQIYKDPNPELRHVIWNNNSIKQPVFLFLIYKVPRQFLTKKFRVDI